MLYYLFFPSIRFLNKHCCTCHPSIVRGRPSIQPFFFVQAKKLCGSSLHWYIPIAQRIVDALLYLIPLGNFNCVILGGSSGAVYELVEYLPFWNMPVFRESLSRFIGRAGGKTGTSNSGIFQKAVRLLKMNHL